MILLIMGISGVRRTVLERVTVLQNVEQRVEGLPQGTFQHCCLLLARGNCYSGTKKVGSFSRRAEVGKGRER
jgi:hypothetical protein